MFHISYFQAKQDQLEADGLFNPAFFGNQARGFLISTSDFTTKSCSAFVAWYYSNTVPRYFRCIFCQKPVVASVGQGSDPRDWIRIHFSSAEPDLGSPKVLPKIEN
jgi:hypothetical protein